MVRPMLLLAALAACEAPPSRTDNRINDLWEHVEVLEMRWENLDACLFRKMPLIEDTFTMKMAIQTCLTVARPPRREP